MLRLTPENIISMILLAAGIVSGTIALIMFIMGSMDYFYECTFGNGDSSLATRRLLICLGCAIIASVLIGFAFWLAFYR